MKIKAAPAILTLSALLLFSGCTDKSDLPVVLKAYPVENLEGLITRTGVEIDSEITSDGNGSIKIATPESTTVSLYETGDLDIENARLVYQAKVRTENVIGQVFLEMWCDFKGKGEYFSRGLNRLVTSTTEWSDTETVFYLREGENPDNIKLDIVINGVGTVWIDDIKLIKYPL